MDRRARSRLNDAMARLADGDRSAFDDVYAALRPFIESFTRRILGSAPDADDAAQQALVKVFERATTYTAGRDAVTWALAIAAWECRTIKRRRWRRREVGLDRATERPSERSPEQETIARDLERAVVDALRMLSDADRETLCSTEDERPADVAGATFRKRRERAVARLRDAWRRAHGTD